MRKLSTGLSGLSSEKRRLLELQLRQKGIKYARNTNNLTERGSEWGQDGAKMGMRWGYHAKTYQLYFACVRGHVQIILSSYEQ
jgi:hypothetical protein